MNLYDLICTAQEDNYDALEELIKREQKNIYASFCYLGASKENISDLTQEALFRMTKNIKTLKNPEAVILLMQPYGILDHELEFS